MATTSPARIDDDLYASAKLAGEVQSRSASQQVAHWARIGREIEASSTLAHKEIVEVLAGSRSYDALTAKEQAVVRAEWSARMDARRDALTLADDFVATGRTWVELDADGTVVERSGAPRTPEGRNEARLMPDPVLHVLVGPNGAGKSSLYDWVIEPTTHLDFVNADAIAAHQWPDDPAGRSYDAATLAAERRAELIERRASFVTETVFSHVSKLKLVEDAVAAGYVVTMHVVMVPEDLAVARVASRVANGGHAVPAEKVRGRYARLWPLVASAIALVDNARVYDNSRIAPSFRLVATFERGAIVGAPDWPSWTPQALRGA